MNKNKYDIECGKYKNFKNKNYIVYCAAIDSLGNEYVLYREDYDKKNYWIRPFDMFFETVNNNGEDTPRFAPTNKSRGKNKKKPLEMIETLIQELEGGEITITESETNEVYRIANISNDNIVVQVSPVNSIMAGGFLSDELLAKRMGFYLCRVNDQIKVYKSAHYISPANKLIIGNNDEAIINTRFNPCSIDLPIDDKIFLASKHKRLDPRSLVHHNNASKLWKNAKKHTTKSHGSVGYTKLKPGQTILTRTQEKISIPNDCAGKVEIKSTYARLSLSITSGDFCNPGYVGHFPLEITNNGKHTVYIYEGEIMAQLMLIPISGTILNSYAQKSSHKNDQGFDDGTPYTFWKERSIKNIKQKWGDAAIVALYEKILDEFNAGNTDDINGEKRRFEDNFLKFCDNVLKINADIKLNKLIDMYISKEKALERIARIRPFGYVLSLVVSFKDVIWTSILNKTIDISSVSLTTWILIVVVVIIICLVEIWIKSKKFCTLKKIDVQDIVKEVEKEHKTIE